VNKNRFGLLFVAEPVTPVYNFFPVIKFCKNALTKTGPANTIQAVIIAIRF